MFDNCSRPTFALAAWDMAGQEMRSSASGGFFVEQPSFDSSYGNPDRYEIELNPACPVWGLYICHRN